MTIELVAYLFLCRYIIVQKCFTRFVARRPERMYMAIRVVKTIIIEKIENEIKTNRAEKRWIIRKRPQLIDLPLDNLTMWGIISMSIYISFMFDLCFYISEYRISTSILPEIGIEIARLENYPTYKNGTGTRSLFRIPWASFSERLESNINAQQKLRRKEDFSEFLLGEKS